MKKIVEQITKELSLRKPQALSLVKLDSILSNIKLRKESLDEIEAKLVGNIKFDTEFPSFTFALATGVGKTRLMGASIAYLHHKYGLKDFFILTPGETIYTKTIKNFTQGNKKYTLDGLTDFPLFNLITGENYEYSNFGNQLFDAINIYVFNIQKIFNERTDVEFKFHKYQETLGSSFAELLQKKDMVFLMDESHRYRGPKSIKAINHLRPILGLEFTATPASENVIYSYSLADAILDSKEALKSLGNGNGAKDGYIKIPYVIARSDDYTYQGDVELVKLEDGIRRHREKKVLIEEYCKNNKVPFVLPVTLVTTKSIQHAKDVKALIESDSFFKGYYKNKTLLVTSESEVDSINQLLHLEEPFPINKNEIVIHVDKLKEGWDVKNVYTIIPFRASISKTLIEQTIGRGLRLPFGELTGIETLDSLDIISHDNFAKVLSVAHEVAEGIEVKKADKREDLNTVEIKPTSDKSLLIEVPAIETKVYSTNDIAYFPIKVTLEELKKITPKLIKADIVSEQTEDIEKIEFKDEINPVNRIVRMIILEMTEFDISHKSILQKIVKHYLEQLKVEDSDLSKAIRLHEQTILNDILSQLKKKLQEKTKIEHKTSDEHLVFGPYFKSIKSSSKPLDKDKVDDSEIVDNILEGYKKSVYQAYIFDSVPEKILADSLEKDRAVISWLRLRNGQLPIKHIYGNYNPDFIVKTKDTNYLVEVKDKSKLDNKDKDVFQKAGQAREWCEIATKATGKKWVYKLLPHTTINKVDSFKGVISSAYKFE
ncbi:MAG: DEAD/DEAH box helicase family protein [Candidatus Pacebacteria bacterium]|nr:DEAD/DEAH box helicase family protein [Candidatus Paceibacterota bacterium]